MTVVNRVLAALLALALLLGGALAATEIVLAQLNRPYLLVPHRQWAADVRDRTFVDGTVRAVLVALVVIGLLLLLAALRRGRPRALTLPSAGADVHVTATRRSVERTLRDATQRLSGVSSADVKAGRRTVAVTAHTAGRSPDTVQDQVTAAVAGRLEQLGLDSTLSPRVRVVGGGGR